MEVLLDIQRFTGRSVQNLWNWYEIKILQNIIATSMVTRHIK
jgi:hypothetical protein